MNIQCYCCQNDGQRDKDHIEEQVFGDQRDDVRRSRNDFSYDEQIERVRQQHRDGQGNFFLRIRWKVEYESCLKLGTKHR